MNSIFAQREKLTFPELPPELLISQRHLLSGLEARLSEGNMRTALQLKPSELCPELVFICIDRLFRYTTASRILLVVAASLRMELVRHWEKAISMIDHQLLTQLYPTHYHCKPLCEQTTCLCIATPREIQLDYHASTDMQSAFDVVIMYGYPSIVALSELGIASSFDALLIGFMDQVDLSVREKLLGDNIVEYQRHSPFKWLCAFPRIRLLSHRIGNVPLSQKRPHP